MVDETGMGRGRWATIRAFVFARYAAAMVLAGIVASSLLFRVHVSRECSLWLDEVHTHFGSLKPWPELLRGPSKAHPPLMYLLIAGAIRVFGDDETGLRSVSLFFGCVLLLATYELCLELKLGARRALVVVALLALSPFFVRHATEARHYAMVGALATLATTRALRIARKAPGRYDLLAFAASAVALAWTHYFGLAYALVLVGVVIVGVVPIWNAFGTTWRVALVGLLLSVSVALGAVALRAVNVGRLYSVGTVEGEPPLSLNSALLLDILREFAFLARSSPWSLVSQALLALLGLLLLSWRLHGVARLVPLGLGVMPCAAALLLRSKHFVAPRYLSPSAVLFHLGVCVALFAAVDVVRGELASEARFRRLAPLIGAAMLCLVVGARLREYPNGFGAAGTDYRGLQRYFVSELADDTRLVAFAGDFGVLISREYPIGSRPLRLERFRPVKGIDRYLVAEFHVDGERRADLESLVEQHFGLSPEEWRAIPLVRLPHSKYQPPVAARLVNLSRLSRGRRKRPR